MHAEHPEGDPKPDLIPLEVPVPPSLAATFGYRAGAPCVGFRWEPSGGDVFFDNGRLSGTGASWSVLAYLRHRNVAPHLEPYNLGYSEENAEHVLVIDRENDLAGTLRHGTSGSN